MATCLTSARLSALNNRRREVPGPNPFRINDRPFCPYEGSTKAWVATTPTPGSPQGTMEPTENQCDWTATPICPALRSIAAMEYVETRRDFTKATAVSEDKSLAGATQGPAPAESEPALVS